MTSFIGKDGKGNDINLIEEDGMRYPVSVVQRMECGSFRGQLEQARDLESRDDDILVVGYVKSGTHWLWEIVTMIQHETTEYVKNPKEHSMLEFSSKEEIDIIPSPRVLSMHFPARWTPKQMLEKRCPIIHIMRNPKDLFVSYYNHYNTTTLYQHLDCFSALLPMMLGENGFYLKMPWFEYVLEWEKFTKDNPDYPILNLYYEDLKRDLTKAVALIAKFLKKDLGDEVIQEIAKKTNIEGMRKSNSQKEFGKFGYLKQFVVDGQPIMYRKGVVGDWKSWFTVAENERVDAWLKKHLVNTNLKFQYT